MRILAIDPGSKNIGIALSDPTGKIASPIGVIAHVSRREDAAAIAALAAKHGAGRIVVGQALDEYGESTFEGRRAARLAAAIRQHTHIPVQLWDESFSTFDARASREALGIPKRKRRGHMDELAAAIILQSYLDAQLREFPDEDGTSQEDENEPNISENRT